MHKKIIFIDSYSDSLYGAQKSMINLCSLVRSNGHQVTISSMKEGVLLEEARNLKFATFSFEANSGLLKSTTELKNVLHRIVHLFMLFFFWLKVILKLKEIRKYDTVCINDARAFFLLLPVLMCSRNKNIWYIRIRENKTKLAYFLSFFCKSAIFISSDVKYNTKLSKFVKTYLLMTGFEKYKRNITSGFDTGNIINFVTVGSINHRKNQLELLSIFKFLASKTDVKCVLHIYGSFEPADLSYYKRVLDTINNDVFLKNSVILHGYINDVTIHIEKHDIFLFASRREGLPRSIIEAIQAGLYVMCKPVDGVSDIIANSSIGIIFNDKSDLESIDMNSIVHNALSISEREKRNAYINTNFSNEAYISNFERILILN